VDAGLNVSVYFHKTRRRSEGRVFRPQVMPALWLRIASESVRPDT
jgi:hypothetical protein